MNDRRENLERCGVVLYRSKYGATKRYANWLSEEMGFDCTEIGKASWRAVERCSTIVLCGGIYASGIAGLAFLRKNASRLRGRKIAVLSVGASPYEEKAFHALAQHNLRGDLAGIPLFYGRGAWDEGRMTFGDRALCKLLQRSIAKKDPQELEPWMQALLCASGQVCDWTDRSYLAPLLDYLQEK